MPGPGTSPFFSSIDLTSHRPMRCRVETYSGYRLHERPRRFTWGETWLEVNQVTDQWLTPGYRCFEVRVAGCAYLLKYNQAEDVWEVELVRPRAGSPAGGKIIDLLFHGL